MQTNRWVEALRGYFFFQVWEAANRSRGTIPTLDEYTVARMQSGAVKATMMLLDVAEGYELPCTVIDWDNDIASHHKESLRSKDNQNLRDILAHEQDLSQQEALCRAIAVRDRVMVHFLRLKHAVTQRNQSPGAATSPLCATKSGETSTGGSPRIGTETQRTR